MDKSNKPPIQFTELTSSDIITHKKCYSYLLLEDTQHTLGEKDKELQGKELHEAMQLFYEAFK